jgi:hypothetical protein
MLCYLAIQRRGFLSLEVRRWLEKSGFGQYAELFEAHRIDAVALNALTERHLGEMGIPEPARLLPTAAHGPNAAG